MAVLTKISRPRLAEILPRERLFSCLDQAAAREVIWVSAPAGSGKTTLVASWLDGRKLPSLWYQLDRGDGDPATFFHYLGLAVKNAVPRHRTPLPLFTPEYQFGLDIFCKRFFESLFCRLKPPAVIVFDDYQELPTESPLHQAMRAGLEAVPQGATVVIISREAPSAAVARQKAGGRMETLGWGDLRLTLDETQGFAKLHGKQDSSPFSLLQLHEKTQGWAAGLVLMMSGTETDITDHPSRSETLYRQEVFDYFAGELFEKAEGEMQKFLLATAFLPSMTALMAEKLSGIAAAEKLLSYLYRNHFFTELYAGDSPTYQYHPLFKEFLLARAKDFFSPEELSRIQRRAAAVLEEAGQIENAAELLLAVGDWEEIARLALNQAQTLTTQGRGKILEDWLLRIPGTFLANNPWLSFWRGVCRLHVDPNEARDFLEKALIGFDTDGDPVGVFTAWAFAVDTFFCDPSEVAQLDHWITLIDALMKRHPSFPSPIIAAQVATGMLFALSIRQPQRPDIENWAERALALSTETRDPNLIGKTAQYLILHHIWTGNLTAAGALIESLRQSECYKKASPPIAFLLVKFLETINSWLSAQHEVCLVAVSEALAVAKHSGVHIFDYLLFGQGASAALSAGDLTVAQEFLGNMAPVLGSGRRNDISYYHHMASWHSLLRNEIVLASVQAETASNLAVECGSPFAEGVCALMFAQILHRCDEHCKAAHHLARARHIGSQMKSSLIEFSAYLSEAQFAFDRGEEECGRDFLRSALAIGREKNLMNFGGWHPGVMARLCAKALGAGIETEYVRELIRRRKLTPVADEIAVVEQWPWPLKISTLGCFELVKDGEPVGFSGKVQKRPLELLKVLIALGGKEVREEQISDLLWPDGNGDQAHKSFESNLLRLRRLLGHDDFVILREGRLTLNRKYIFVDIWGLEEVIGRAEAMWQRGSDRGNELDLLTKRFFNLYRGHFLASEADSPWVFATRERLRGRCIDFVENMRCFWVEHGEPERALACVAGWRLQSLQNTWHKGYPNDRAAE